MINQFQVLQKRKLSPKIMQPRSDQEERKTVNVGKVKRTDGNWIDYMRDTFLNLTYRAKGGMDKNMLARTLSAGNDSSYLWRKESR